MKEQHVTYDSIAVGDRIPSFETFETQETIDNTRMPEITARPPRPNIHTDPEFAKRGLFAGTVNGGVITMAYVTTMLERWFPAASFYEGGRLEFKAIQPFRPGDTVVFTGTVTGKRRVNGKAFVDCEIRGTNQLGQIMGFATATLSV